MLTVIVVNDYSFVNGGAAQVALDSAIGLSGRGHVVIFFSAVGPAAEPLSRSSVRVEIMGQQDIRTDPNRLRAATQGIWNESAGRRFDEILMDLDPSSTIVHLHGWAKALSSSVVRVAQRRRFSIVATMHDYFYACPAGGFYNFRTESACKLRPMSNDCIREKCDRDGYGHKLWRVARQLTQNTVGSMRELKHFILLSETSRAALEPYLPEGAHLYRIANPIGTTKSGPIDVGANSKFIAIGRLSSEKGVELMAEAASDLRCEMLCVGDGPSRSKVGSLNPQAVVTGWQPREQVMEHLRSARALVFPSIWYEAQPLVVLEAAAMGVPAVVSDMCAAKEMVDDGVTGLWFRSGDVTDLRQKMERMANCTEAARMGKAAFDRYWRNPQTLEKHVLDLEDCYLKILSTKSEKDVNEERSSVEAALESASRSPR